MRTLKVDKSISKKDFIKGACEYADIYEADAGLNNSEAKWYGFNYFDGIASYYKNYSADPFYNPQTGKRKRNYTRPGWLTEELHEYQ